MAIPRQTAGVSKSNRDAYWLLLEPVVDGVLGVERVKHEALQPSISRREFTRGVGPNDTIVLDIEALLGSGRFNVSDEA